MTREPEQVVCGKIALLLLFALATGCVLPPAQGSQPSAGGAPHERELSDVDEEEAASEQLAEDRGDDSDRTESDRTESDRNVSGQWSCRSEGSYETCSGSTGLCTTWPAIGMGLGSSESQARIQANANCGEHMSQSMMTANLGDSQASIRSSCEVTSCSAP